MDATSYVYWGTFQTGVASYLAWDNLSAVEFIFTLHHVWYVLKGVVSLIVQVHPVVYFIAQTKWRADQEHFVRHDNVVLCSCALLEVGDTFRG